jgi:hypothetical protein
MIIQTLATEASPETRNPAAGCPGRGRVGLGGEPKDLRRIVPHEHLACTCLIEGHPGEHRRLDAYRVDLRAATNLSTGRDSPLGGGPVMASDLGERRTWRTTVKD